MSPLAPILNPTARVLVTDFDGTMTRDDFFKLVRERWPSPAGDDPWEDYVSRRCTHFEALARIFSRIRADEATLSAVVSKMGLDPELPKAVARLQDAGWSIVIASAGCDWYIKRLLSSAGVKLELHANPGELLPGGGLEMKPPLSSRFYSSATGINKVTVVREALDRSAEVAFAGDGRPDLEPALMVSPQRRFARGWLAEHLRTVGQPFVPFEHWSEIAERLLTSEH